MNKLPNWIYRLEPLKRFIILVPIVAGILIFAFLRNNHREPQAAAAEESQVAVRTLAAPVADVAPRVTAFGTAAPAQTWRAIAEVSGRLVEVHKELRPGAIFKTGTTLLKIDKTDYQFAVEQLQAEIDQVESQIAESNQQEENNVASLAIEKKTLAVSQAELRRLDSLVLQNAGAQAEADAQSRVVLGQERKCQDIDNAQKVLVIQRASLEASLRLKQSKLKQANRDLERTEFVCPFDCRVGDVSLELNQFVAAGELLLEGFGTGMAEIEAKVPMREAQLLVAPQDSSITLSAIIGSPMDVIREMFQTTVNVAIANDLSVSGWEGTFLRVREELDQQTRTVGLVVGVEKPYDKAIPGKKPPLFPGVFCRVEFEGTTRKNRVVIPSSAIHNGRVYLLDRNDRLVIKRIQVDFSQEGYSVLSSGLEGGERIVLSHPTPAIEGMLTTPVDDPASLAQILDQIPKATPEGSVAE